MYLRKTCIETTNSVHHKTKVILYILEVGIFYFIKFTLGYTSCYTKTQDKKDYCCPLKFFEPKKLGLDSS